MRLTYQRLNFPGQARTIAWPRCRTLINASLLVNQDVSRYCTLEIAEHIPHIANKFLIGPEMITCKPIDLDALPPPVAPLSLINRYVKYFNLLAVNERLDRILILKVFDTRVAPG